MGYIEMITKLSKKAESTDREITKIYEEIKNLNKQKQAREEKAFFKENEEKRKIEELKIALEEIDKKQERIKKELREARMGVLEHVNKNSMESKKKEKADNLQVDDIGLKENKIKSNEEMKKHASILIKGLKYNKQKINEIIRNYIGECEYERMKANQCMIIKFENPQKKIELLKMRSKIYKEGIIRVDDWLDEKERQARRQMVKIAREKRFEGRTVFVKDRSISIDSRWYVWDGEKGELKESKKDKENEFDQLYEEEEAD